MSYIANIEEETLANNNFRKVLHTGKFSQLVAMSLEPGEAIGSEVHNTVDQFIRIESGEAKAVLDGVETVISDDYAVVIPAGVEHNVINTSSKEQLKLYTIYSPPEHRDGTVHASKKDAIADEDDHYEG